MSTTGPLGKLDRGFRYLTLNPTPRLRAHQVKVRRTDTVALAWLQTGRAIRIGMRTVKGNSSVQKR